MSLSPKRKKNDEFWRACRFLGPYTDLVVISTICAFVAGTVMTGGITAIIPILHVLINGQTVQSWVAGIVAAHHPAWYYSLLTYAANLLPLNPVGTIAIIFLALAILNLFGNIVRFFYEYLSDKSVINAINDLRRVLYDHVLHIPIGFFAIKGTSDVTTQLVQDSMLLQDGLKIIFGQSVFEVIKAILALGLALLIDWRLTIFMVLFAPITAVIFKKFGKKMRRASRAALQTNSVMLGQIESSLAGIRVVKGNNAERFERRRYAAIMLGLREELLKMARYEALSTPVLETMAMWGAGAVLIFAAYLRFSPNVKHPLDVERFFAIMACLVSIGESMRRLSKLNSVFQRCNAAAARIFQTLDVPIERSRHLPMLRVSKPQRGQINLPPIQQEVRFESVSFSYANTASPAVVDVDLVIPKGRSIAIVGRNGSGKTTLMAMLPRFYDPDAGRITIDGIDIRKATLRSLRRQITIVTQDSVIFPGTIAQNVAYGHPLASKLNDNTPISNRLREQIESAAKRAFAHDFIMEKPNGYDASLDGLGGQLSGGQKQRLNIARAILRQSPILILDEATSQVDAESEHLIQQAIESLMHERTTFVIAHRFSTILSADSIVVMDRGRIVGQGKHDELLRTCQTYQQLYERQMVGSNA